MDEKWKKTHEELAVVRGVDVGEELTPTRQQGENGRSDVTRSKSSACHSPLADFKPLYDCRGEGQWFEGEGGRVMEDKHSVWMVDGRRRSLRLAIGN